MSNTEKPRASYDTIKDRAVLLLPVCATTMMEAAGIVAYALNNGAKDDARKAVLLTESKAETIESLSRSAGLRPDNTHRLFAILDAEAVSEYAAQAGTEPHESGSMIALVSSDKGMDDGLLQKLWEKCGGFLKPSTEDTFTHKPEQNRTARSAAVSEYVARHVAEMTGNVLRRLNQGVSGREA